MVQNKDESLETFAILPFGKFLSMEKRLKKAEGSDEELPSPATKPQSNEPSEVEEVEVKEVLPTSTKSTSEDAGKKKKDLIKSALGNSRKTLANEKEFFNFLFANNLGHFVKNRSKIALYYDKALNWYEV